MYHQTRMLRMEAGPDLWPHQYALSLADCVKAVHLTKPVSRGISHQQLTTNMVAMGRWCMSQSRNTPTWNVLLQSLLLRGCQEDRKLDIRIPWMYKNRHQSNVRPLWVSGQSITTQPQTSLGCIRLGTNLGPDPRDLFRKNYKDLPYDNCKILEETICGIC